jgi:hypothetical protein
MRLTPLVLLATFSDCSLSHPIILPVLILILLGLISGLYPEE